MVGVLVAFGFAAAAAVVVEPRVRQMERKVRICIFVCLFGDGLWLLYVCPWIRRGV